MTSLCCEQTETIRSPKTSCQDVAAGADTTVDGIRQQLWWAVIQALDDSGLPYCVLGAPFDAAGPTESDFDIVVHPSSYVAISQLLTSAAERAQAHLVQAIHYETTATYFALAKQHGSEVAIINPDCTADYRRGSRLRLTAEELLRDRIRNGGFYRPSPEVEFQYYLIKQVLKQTLNRAQWRNLSALYVRSPQPHVALSLWPAGTSDQIERALRQSNPELFRSLLPRLSAELERTPHREPFAARKSSFTRDVARIVGRVIHPTGLFVQITGAEHSDRTTLARGLTDEMARAFRRTWIVDQPSSIAILRALIESTLVISSSPGMMVISHVEVECQQNRTPAENLATAIAAVISYLSRRTKLRLPLSEAATHLVAPAKAF